jgi:putative inorganic carbon (hco3(-)) transporter
VLRELFFAIAFPAAFIWALLSAQASVLVLNWIWFQRPYEFSWGFWNTQPMFTAALAVAILSNVMRGQFRPKVTPLLAIYLMLMLWLTLSAAFAYNQSHAWGFFQIFMPSMWVSPIVMFAVIHDLRLLKLVFWVAAGGLGLNAAKVGLSVTLSGGGHLTQQVAGFVGDNNVFALVVCFVVALLIGLRSTLPEKRIVRALFWVLIGLALLCVVYTRSRGAYVALGAIFLTSSLLGPKPLRHSLAVITVAAIGYWLLPDENFDRLSTLRDVRADDSAMGRVENWALAWNMTLANPIFGVGMDNHIPYNREVVRPDVQVRVAHSVYFQVLRLASLR